MKLVFISDTHMQLDKIEIPEGDILCHSGDLTYRGSVEEVIDQLDVLQRQFDKFEHIVIIDGNHDWLGQRLPNLMKTLCEDRKINYLQDSSVTLEGLKFFGSPWQIEFCNWAFNLPAGKALQEKWALIPTDTDVLLTHSPPKYILDGVEKYRNGNIELQSLGCPDLRHEVATRLKLKVHSFGHLHLQGGQKLEMDGTTYVNAAICNEQYLPINPIVVLDVKCD